MIDFGSNELEIRSPVMSRLRDIMQYYDFVCDVVRKEGMQPHLNGHMSGGGHLHVSPIGKKWDTGLVYEIFRDWLNRPWLNWIFNDPEDDWNASSMMTRSYGGEGDTYEIVDYLWEHKKKLTKKTSRHVYGLPNGKDHGVVWRGGVGKGTIEFRFFDAPKNRREQELHVLFMDHWLTWLQKRWARGKRTPLRYRWPQDIQAVTLEQCEHEFIQMLTDIGLEDLTEEYIDCFFPNAERRYKEKLRRD